MVAAMTDGPHKVLVVEWEEGNSKALAVLDLDAKAQMNVKANPVGGLYGRALVEALQDRGAVLNDAVGVDGTVVPAVQVFNAASGALIAARRYAQGQPVADLSQQELAELSARKSSPVALPESVRPFVRPGLKPVL